MKLAHVESAAKLVEKRKYVLWQLKVLENGKSILWVTLCCDGAAQSIIGNRDQDMEPVRLAAKAVLTREIENLDIQLSALGVST